MYNNMEAEQGLIGSIFIRNEVLHEVDGILRAEDFATSIHGEIFEKCKEAVSRGGSASPVTLKAHFENHPDLHEMPDYLFDVAGSVVSAINVEHYAKIIVEAAEKRRISFLMDYIQKRIDSGDDISALRLDLITELEQSTRGSNFVKTKREVAIEASKGLSLPKACDAVGIKSLDAAMSGGLYAGFTYGIAGAEKMGKTTLAHTISHNLNQSGVDHAYIALEMGSRQIEQRNMARDINTNSIAFLKNPDAIAQQAARYASTVKNHTLYLDMPGCDFQTIQAELTRLVVKKKIKGFILDYWQLVSGGHDNRPAFLYDVAQGLANFCRKHQVWSIIVAQVNRNGQLFGSAGLEKACDQLYVINEAKGTYCDDGRYLDMTHTRYTPKVYLGDEESPKFAINKVKGPYFEELS